MLSVYLPPHAVDIMIRVDAAWENNGDEPHSAEGTSRLGKRKRNPISTSLTAEMWEGTAWACCGWCGRGHRPCGATWVARTLTASEGGRGRFASDWSVGAGGPPSAGDPKERRGSAARSPSQPTIKLVAEREKKFILLTCPHCSAPSSAPRSSVNAQTRSQGESTKTHTRNSPPTDPSLTGACVADVGIARTRN